MASTQRTRRLRRSDCSEPGLRRVRRGRGFAYLDDRGRAPDPDPEVLERLRGLAIPPAWQRRLDLPRPVRAPTGHRDRRRRPQAVPLPPALARAPRPPEVSRGWSASGRSCRRSAGGSRRISGATPLLTRERVLACAVRLLDVGMFRIGSEQYADDDGGPRARDDRETARHRWATTARCSTTPPRAGSGARR